MWFGNPHQTLAIHYQHHTELVIEDKEKLTAQKI
jgi:fatty acid desaturase